MVHGERAVRPPPRAPAPGVPAPLKAAVYDPPHRASLLKTSQNMPRFCFWRLQITIVVGASLSRQASECISPPLYTICALALIQHHIRPCSSPRLPYWRTREIDVPRTLHFAQVVHVPPSLPRDAIPSIIMQQQQHRLNGCMCMSLPAAALTGVHFAHAQNAPPACRISSTLLRRLAV